MITNKPRVLYMDIETSLCHAYVWSPGKQYVSVNQLSSDRMIMTIAWKFGDEKTVHAATWGTGKSLASRMKGEKRMLKAFAKAVEQADIMVTHNGARFDVPIIKARMMAHDLPALTEVIQEDTYQMCRGIGLQSKKLNEIARVLGVGRKIKSSYQWWVDLLESNDQASMDEMVKYNKMDVTVLEAVHKKVVKYAPVKGHRGVISGKHRDDSCPTCGSEDIGLNTGAIYRYTSTGRYYRFKCNDCGAGWRGRKQV